MIIKAIKIMMLASTLLLMGLTPNPEQGRQVAGSLGKSTVSAPVNAAPLMQQNQ